jgi:hypothetical protein
MGEASLDQGNPPRDIEHRSKYSILPEVRLHPVAHVSLELWDFSLHGPQALALNQAHSSSSFCSPCLCTTAQAARRAEPVAFPDRQEVVDILRNGYVPGSEGDRMFTAIHWVNRWLVHNECDVVPA